jgi:hypothetical protein
MGMPKEPLYINLGLQIFKLCFLSTMKIRINLERQVFSFSWSSVYICVAKNTLQYVCHRYILKLLEERRNSWWQKFWKKEVNGYMKAWYDCNYFQGISISLIEAWSFAIVFFEL